MSTESEGIVRIPAGGVELEGALAVPDDAPGIVLFAHGSGSSRHSPRNNYVAGVLREHGVGTLLFDLLTEAEDVDRATRFDVDLLTERLLAATAWLRGREEAADRRLGFFGSSTGAAAALRAAAEAPDVAAVVSRGGRVDMAAESLADVEAATLFVVGGADYQVLELNREAYDVLTCEKELHVVEGAGHLFEGSGQLEEVAEVAADWFAAHLAG